MLVISTESYYDAQIHEYYIYLQSVIIIEFLTFSAPAEKHSHILGCVINRIRLDGLIYNLKSSLQLNMFQELQIFTFVCTYSDTA